MQKSKLMATTSGYSVVAFNNGSWKTDDDGNLVTNEAGDPIFVTGDGREMSMQGGTVSRLNEESRGYRERAEKAEQALKSFESIDDPKKAIEALQALDRIEKKELIDAGEVDRVRQEIGAEYQEKLTALENQLAERSKTIDSMKVDAAFASSQFVSEGIAIPRSFFEAQYRNNFKVEDGNLIAYDGAGNPINSGENIGERAGFDEALKILVSQSPEKDNILRAPDAAGSGNGGNGGNRGRSRSIPRADFDNLEPFKQAEVAAQAAKGEVTITE